MEIVSMVGKIWITVVVVLGILGIAFRKREKFCEWCLWTGLVTSLVFLAVVVWFGF